MGLRGILVITLIGLGTVVALVRPWIGGITWNWISFMNPHRLTWNIRNWPVAQGVAITTLIGLVFTRERRPVPMRAETVLMGGLFVYFCITTLFAWDPSGSLPQLDRVMKIFLFIFVSIMLFYGRKKIRWLMLVSVLSIGFFGLKGGIFALATGGHYRVYGPPESFIGDNNSLGLAMTMILPMAFYAAKTETNRWIRLLLNAVFFFSIPAIMFTYSRGALLGLVATLFVVLWRYKKSWLIIGLIVGAAVLYFGHDFLPHQWIARQETTIHYKQNYSAMQRIQSWGVSLNVALHRPLLGAGFNLVGAGSERWLSYANFLGPWYNQPRAAHSIWFQILGEHGFVALLMFVSLLFVTWSRLGRTAKRAHEANILWIYYYARGMQLALVPYMVAGTFLSLAYFDLYYTCVGFSVILSRALTDCQARTHEIGIPAQVGST